MKDGFKMHIGFKNASSRANTYVNLRSLKLFSLLYITVDDINVRNGSRINIKSKSCALTHYWILHAN